MNKVKLLCVICLVLCAKISGAENVVPFSEEFIEAVASHTTGEKLYLKTGVIYLSDKGIFVCADGELFPINTISCDEHGIYIQWDDISPKIWKDACPNGHTNLCGICGGCLNVCRYRCVCSPF